MKNIFKFLFLSILLIGCSAPTKNVAQPGTTTTTSTTLTPMTTTTAVPVATTTTTTVPAITTSTEPETTTAPVVQEVDPLLIAYAEAVPNRWRNRFPFELQIIPGGTSRCCGHGIMSVSEIHLNGPRSRLIFTLAHEFGHGIESYYIGSEFNGDSPKWPIKFDREQWADCVAVAFTDIRGYGICNRSDLLQIAQQFVSNPPAKIGV